MAYSCHMKESGSTPKSFNIETIPQTPSLPDDTISPPETTLISLSQETSKRQIEIEQAAEDQFTQRMVQILMHGDAFLAGKTGWEEHFSTMKDILAENMTKGRAHIPEEEVEQAIINGYRRAIKEIKNLPSRLSLDPETVERMKHRASEILASFQEQKDGDEAAGNSIHITNEKRTRESVFANTPTHAIAPKKQAAWLKGKKPSQKKK